MPSPPTDHRPRPVTHLALVGLEWIQRLQQFVCDDERKGRVRPCDVVFPPMPGDSNRDSEARLAWICLSLRAAVEQNANDLRLVRKSYVRAGGCSALSYHKLVLRLLERLVAELERETDWDRFAQSAVLQVDVRKVSGSVRDEGDVLAATGEWTRSAIARALAITYLEPDLTLEEVAARAKVHRDTLWRSRDYKLGRFFVREFCNGEKSAKQVVDDYWANESANGRERQEAKAEKPERLDG